MCSETTQRGSEREWWLKIIRFSLRSNLVNWTVIEILQFYLKCYNFGIFSGRPVDDYNPMTIQFHNCGKLNMNWNMSSSIVQYSFVWMKMIVSNSSIFLIFISDRCEKALCFSKKKTSGYSTFVLIALKCLKRIPSSRYRFISQNTNKKQKPQFCIDQTSMVAVCMCVVCLCSNAHVQ